MSAPDQADTELAASISSSVDEVQVTVDEPGDRATVIAASRCGSAIVLSIGDATARLAPARAAAVFVRMAALAAGQVCAPQLRGALPAGTPPYPPQLRGLMRLSEPQRWVDCTDGIRHAIPSDILFTPGDLVTTFCGLPATVDAPDTRHQGTHKECADCAAVACELLGYPHPQPTQHADEEESR